LEVAVIEPPPGTFFHRFDANEDPASILRSANHCSTPWGAPDHGPCDKCRGTGRARFGCLSCIEGIALGSCPACQGRVHFIDTCPTCGGSGVIDDTARRGLSVFPSLRGLYRYLVERDVDLEGCVILELTGDLTGERDFDADAGALLVTPTEIVGRLEIDTGYVERLRRRLARTAAVERV
jgi:hypothetical protein